MNFQIEKLSKQQLQELAIKAVRQQERQRKSSKKHQEKLKQVGMKRVTIEANEELESMLKYVANAYKNSNDHQLMELIRNKVLKNGDQQSRTQVEEVKKRADIEENFLWDEIEKQGIDITEYQSETS